jgi:hypothetical protein
VNLSPRKRALLLAVDGLALVGVIAFSVAAAVKPDQSVYMIGQIASAVIVLAAALLLRRAGNNP